MNLVLEIDFLTGVCRAARGVGDVEPDWPPQPDRVFSALVSAWGARGQNSEERDALEWLERQPPPTICASGYTARTAPDVFVPPNDLRASTAMKTYIKVLPERRPRQPRRFPVARPDDPKLELIWPEAPAAKVVDALNALAGCVGYVGHSASLARCRFVAKAAENSGRSPKPARRCIYPGRLRELEIAYMARPERPIIQPGMSVPHEASASPGIPAKWLVLEVVNENLSDVPDIRASATICRDLRRALMAGYRRAGKGDAIPEMVSGHTADGTPTRKPHLAVVPMAFVGFSHADASVLGFALVPPQGVSLLSIDGLRNAFEKIAAYRPDEQRRVLSLQGPTLRIPLELAPVQDQGSGKRSLQPNSYLKKTAKWASVTPIVLERHLKRGNDAEVRELVALACKNAGLPQPDLERIRIGKHSAITGAPPARPLRGAPPWTRWKMPKSLESRQLVHAVIDFGQDVCGPVLLGAGRFTGLGLCRGLDNRK